MNTAVINIKVNPSVKKSAQEVAEELGLSLSGIINGFLKQLVRTREVSFSANEIPSDYLVELLKEAMKDAKDRRVSPKFSRAEDAIVWLHENSKKYAG